MFFGEKNLIHHSFSKDSDAERNTTMKTSALVLGLLAATVLGEPSPPLAGRSLHWVIRVSALEDTLAFMLEVLQLVQNAPGPPC